MPTTPTTTPVTTEEADACPSGQELYGGKCVPKCPTGYKRNEKTGECEEDLCPVECDDTTLDY